MSTGPQGIQGNSGVYGPRGITGATGWGYGTTTGPTGGYPTGSWGYPTFIDNQSTSITATAATAGSIYRITSGTTLSLTLPTSTVNAFWMFTNGTNASVTLNLTGSARFSGSVEGVFTTTNSSFPLPATNTCTFVYTGSGSNYYLF